MYENVSMKMRYNGKTDMAFMYSVLTSTHHAEIIA